MLCPDGSGLEELVDPGLSLETNIGRPDVDLDNEEPYFESLDNLHSN